MPSLTAVHFSVVALGQALASGLAHEDRVRAVLHLAGGCPSCLASLEQLAGHEATLGDHLDFVARAILRWLEVLRGKPGQCLEITPIHHYWKERLAHEPAVFSRVVLEEARTIHAEIHPSKGLTVLREALDLLSDARLVPLGQERWHDLQALAMIYLGDSPCSSSSHWSLLSDAHLEHGSRDHEIYMLRALHAFEHERALFWGAVSTSMVRSYLEPAERHLRRWPRSGPAHLAHLRLKQAFYNGRIGQHDEARTQYSEALCHLQPACAWLRYVAAHNLAFHCHALDDAEGMERALPKAEELARQHGWNQYRGERLMLRANLQRRQGDREAAASTFQASIDQYLCDHDRLGALSVLNQLRQLDLNHEPGMGLPALHRQFRAIVRHEGEPFSTGERATVLRLAEELGLPDLGQLRDELEPVNHPTPRDRP